MTTATAPSPSSTPTPTPSIPKPLHSTAITNDQSNASPSPSIHATPNATPTPTNNSHNATAPSSSSVTAPLPPVPTMSTIPFTPIAPIRSTPSATPGPSTSTPGGSSSSIRLPMPYRAPKYSQAGASESFSTAYPTREARQTYASPSKPLPQTPTKRSWQFTGNDDSEDARKRAKPTEVNGTAATPSFFGTPARPPPSSTVTVTGIPKPGSHLSNQVRAETINLVSPNLKPEVPGTSHSRQLKDDYLSLLQKAELIELVRQLEKQLLDVILAPPGTSALYKQARIYPKDLKEQVTRLRVRQRSSAAPLASPATVRAATANVARKVLPSASGPSAAATSNLSLSQVYSLLAAKSSGKDVDVPALSGGTLSSPATVQPAASRPNTTAAAAKSKATSSGSTSSSDDSLADLINSINALVRPQQGGQARPNSATAALSDALQRANRNAAPAAPMSASKAATPARKDAASNRSPAPVSQATIQSILSQGPMPSNASLAAAIAAHFGDNLPSPTVASTPRSAPATRPKAPAPKPLPSKVADSDVAAKIAAILGSSASAQAPMLGPQGIPLAPPPGTPKAPSGTVPIGNIAAMLSSLSANSSPSAPQPSTSGSVSSSNVTSNAADKNTSSGQTAALAKLLKQLEEAKAATASVPQGSGVPAATAMPAPRPQPTNLPTLAPQPNAVRAKNPSAPLPIAAVSQSQSVTILTGANANPLFSTALSGNAFFRFLPEGGASSDSTYYDHTSDFDMDIDMDMSWPSPEAGPVMVQGPSGTSALPSYEDMIVEGLRVIGDEHGTPPRKLFHWMVDTYPLMKNFRPSASQALQKAFKRGRLLKTGSLYRINPDWGGNYQGRRPTRRPQVGKDHPMVKTGPNGEMLAVSPLKDSHAYKNVLDTRNKTAAKAASKPGPRPYGQPGSEPLPNPASNIFQTGTVAALILSHQKKTGKTLDADSIKELLSQIRSSPGGVSTSQALSTLLNKSKLSTIQPTAGSPAHGTVDLPAITTSLPSFSASMSSTSAAPARPPVSTPATSASTFVPALATVPTPASKPASSTPVSAPVVTAAAAPKLFTPVSVTAPSTVSQPSVLAPALADKAPAIAPAPTPKPAVTVAPAPVPPITFVKPATVSQPAKTPATPKPKAPPKKAASKAKATPAKSKAPAIPATPKPTVMQQLARMLNEMNVPLNPALASSLVGQLGRSGIVPTQEALAPLVTAAAASASHTNSRTATPRAGTPTGFASPYRAASPKPSGLSAVTNANEPEQLSTGVSASQLASSLSQVSQNQEDLDSAVSTMLAAALKQINPVPAQAPTLEPTAQDKGKVPEQETEGEGINLADYEDAIRTLTAALNGDDDEEESDEEADERAIAAAEADPVDDGEEEGDDAATQPAPMSQRAAGLEGLLKQFAQPEEEGEDEDEEGDMDLSAIISQLSASLQGTGEEAAEGSGESLQQKERLDKPAEEMDTTDDIWQNSAESPTNKEAKKASAPAEEKATDKAESTDKGTESADKITEGAGVGADTEQSDKSKEAGDSAAPDQPQEASDEARTTTQDAEGGNGDLQAQLEALVASLAANADSDDEDEE